ncbi:MAG: hypothetical protein KDE26_23160, partial [Bacteroidetes bacterium]|nr:hypothetical protein [Bacteroidota bacterium]
MNYFRHILSIILAIWVSIMSLWGQSTTHRVSSVPPPAFGDSDYDSPEIRTHYLRQATFMTSQGASRSGQKYYVNTNATGMNDGSSWADAFTHLEDALFLAGTGDSVWVAQGTYYPSEVAFVPFILANGIHLYGGFAGNEALLSERDISLHPTILSGDIGQDDLSSPLDTLTDLIGTNSLHVIYAVAGKARTVMDGFTVTAGQANADLEDGYGGGVMSFTMPGDTFSMYINHCIFQGNQASRGGGVGIRGINGERTHLEISHSSFLNNHAQTTSFWTASGAAVECFMNIPGTVMKNDYTDCEFKGNTSEDNGGSIHHRDFVDIIDSSTVKSCVFDHNRAVARNPGFSIYGQNGVSGAIIIDSCVFTNNSINAGFGIGGGVAIASDNGEDTLKVNVSNCLFEDNTSWSGGGMSVEAFKIDPLAPGQVVFASMTNCDFINNSTFVNAGYEPFTGGLNLMAASSELNVNIKSCHVEGNSSDIGGGIGIYSFNGAVVKAEVSDCFITGNQSTASSGGLGAFSWTKFPDFPLNPDTATLFLSVDHCLIMSNQSGGDAAGIGLELAGGAYANATFSNIELIGNQATGSGGGLGIIQNAIISGNVIATIDSCSFEGNHAVKGGGLAVDANFNGFTLDQMVNQTRFVKNTSVNGGGLYVYNRGPKELSVKTTNISFLQDSADNQGGAIYGANDASGGSLIIESENTLVNGNHSKSGAISFTTVFGLVNNAWMNGTFVSNTSSGAGSGGAMTQKRILGTNNFS